MRLVASAATTATAATTTTAVATASTTTAATTAALFTRPGLIHRQPSAIVLLAVQPGDGCLGLLIGAHFDKTESFAAAGISVGDDLSTAN